MRQAVFVFLVYGEILMDRKFERNKAFNIGTICVSSYLASYYMRNLLSVCTPGMVQAGTFTKEIVGTFSSVYFLVYAIGQLINGAVGDRVKPKNMVALGLLACGLSSMAFGFEGNVLAGTVLFGLMGFSLSMLRGPLVKTISENTLPEYARICCTFLSFVSIAGPFIASMFAMVFDWKNTFVFAGLSCVVIAACAYAALTSLEKKGIVTTRTCEKLKEKKKIWEVFKLQNFVFYMIVGALVEVSAASIDFWFPTYLTEHLGFQNDMANAIFSAKPLACSFVPFVALIVLKLFRDDDINMSKYSFLLVTLFFVGVLLVKNPYLNVAFYFLSSIAIRFASALLWSVYIPNQAKSGMVSTVNGVLDFSGYAAASVANMVFSFSMEKVGWNGLVVMWIVLMSIGVVAACFAKKTKSESEN